jgi:hypothetical protein
MKTAIYQTAASSRDSLHRFRIEWSPNGISLCRLAFPPGTAREVRTILFGTRLPEEFEPPSLAELKALWRRLRAGARRNRRE